MENQFYANLGDAGFNFDSEAATKEFAQSHAPYEFFDYNKLGLINCTHLLLLFSFISTPKRFKLICAPAYDKF